MKRVERGSFAEALERCFTVFYVNIEIGPVAILVLSKVEVGGGLLQLELPNIRLGLKPGVEQCQQRVVTGEHLGLDLGLAALGVGLLLDLRCAPRGGQALTHGVDQCRQRHGRYFFRFAEHLPDVIELVNLGEAVRALEGGDNCLRLGRIDWQLGQTPENLIQLAQVAFLFRPGERRATWPRRDVNRHTNSGHARLCATVGVTGLCPATEQHVGDALGRWRVEFGQAFDLIERLDSFPVLQECFGEGGYDTGAAAFR